MSNVRAEISEKNPYWISKHRYYELKHFCLQYPEWKRRLMDTNYIPERSVGAGRAYTVSDHTAHLVEDREYYKYAIELIDATCLDLDPVIGEYLKKGITLGFSYQTLRTRFDIPCCKDEYYRLYREFFWLLDKRRK